MSYDLFSQPAHFETTSESARDRQRYEKQARGQNEEVLQYVRSVGFASPSQVQEKFPQWPITSIRRALTTMAKAGLLRKTEVQVEGLYGRNEHVWTHG